MNDNSSEPQKKRHKRHRRTNAEIARDRRSEEGKLSTLARRFGTFVQHTTGNIVAAAVSKFHIPLGSYPAEGRTISATCVQD